MNYYKFHIGDFKSHTAHLEPLEELAYRRLLDEIYLHEKPLPDDIDQIARCIRMRTHCDCIAVVLHEFFERTADGWIQGRAMEEIDEFKAKSDKAKASANARWAKKHKGFKKADANALRTQSEGNANHKPITNNHNTKIKRPESVEEQVWDDFVAHRKRCKADITTTALARIETQAKKAGWSLNDALAECVSRGWKGFNCDWVQAKQVNKGGEEWI